MKKMKYLYLIIFVTVLSASFKSQAQHAHFSQFYSSPMILAPSFAGMIDGSRLVLNYRDQWPNIPGNFVTYALAYDHYFHRQNSGIGVLILRDNAGSTDYNTTDIGVQYSYDILAFKPRFSSEWHIRPGIFAKYTQIGINQSKLIFRDQISLQSNSNNFDISSTSAEPALQHIQQRKFVDFSASVLTYSNRVWAGFTLDHILRPNISLIERDATQDFKYSIFGGGKVWIKKSSVKQKADMTVTLATYYRVQAGSDQLDIGAYWSKEPLVLGMWFRGMPVAFNKQTGYDNIDAIILLVGYEIYGVRIGYSYDITVSRLINYTGGAHEVSLIYEFKPFKLKIKDRKVAVACPKI